MRRNYHSEWHSEETRTYGTYLFQQHSTPNHQRILTEKPVGRGSLAKKLGIDKDDNFCLRCLNIQTDWKFILHRCALIPINRQLLSCRQTHNRYILSCLLCNSWDRHEEFTTPHQIYKSLRERGFSISPTEHPHLRQPWDIQLFPV